MPISLFPENGLRTSTVAICPRRRDGRETYALPLDVGGIMPKSRSYHRSRQQAEEAMAADAKSVVARIAHSKLAVLHGNAAGPAGAATPGLAAGEIPVQSIPAF